MSLDVTLRYSKKVRDQLIWLKRQTGLPHFHTLCRWAFCLSISDPRPPRMMQVGGDAEARTQGDAPSTGQSFEVTWDRLGQRDASVLEALLRRRAVAEGHEPEQDVLRKLAQAHVQRGISRLMAGKRLRSITQLVQMAPQHGEGDTTTDSQSANGDPSS